MINLLEYINLKNAYTQAYINLFNMQSSPIYISICKTTFDGWLTAVALHLGGPQMSQHLTGIDRQQVRCISQDAGCNHSMLLLTNHMHTTMSPYCCFLRHIFKSSTDFFVLDDAGHDHRLLSDMRALESFETSFYLNY